MKFPRKKDYRPRAHANPYGDMNIYIPHDPIAINWSAYFKNKMPPDFLDIGCGYGSFLTEIAIENTGKNICGMEIRNPLTEFVDKKIKYYREELNSCNNCAVINTNAFLFLPNFFQKNSLEKIFILFPDPQFKKKKQKARIVSEKTAEIYAFILKPNGRLYISTDVKALFENMVDSIVASPSFKRLEETICNADKIFEKTYTRTDESSRAAVKTGATFAAIFEKH